MALIERNFPIENLNPIALGEGNSKKPVYRMHKWWARRLGSVFRAIVLSAFSDDDESEAAFWHKYCDGADLEDKIILDPFMGGGTTVVEALRLGCKVIGVDINPVAWFVTKKEVEAVELDALDNAYRELELTVGKQIRKYYQTNCPNGHNAEVMYYFWVKVAQCGNCGAKVRLFNNYELSRREDINVSFCPSCLQVIESEGYTPETKCPDCGKVFDPRKGVSERGIYCCPECGTKQKVLDAVQRKGSALDMELHALEGYCEKCGRFFKRTDKQDLARWEQTKAEFERVKTHLLFPQQRIPTEGRSDPRPVNHGYEYFYQMFNERQLLCLSTLLEGILKIADRNVREFLVIAFSDCLNTNNMFCKYEIEWHKISLFFSLHAFHPIERPAENNVWGTSFGRGSFARCFEKVRKAKLYCNNPYERLLNSNGQRYTKNTGKEYIEGRVIYNFGKLRRTNRAALLRCQSSKDLYFIPDKSVDAVITDPPYFDNVQYSELADFFYVWLRLALKDDYSWFEPELSCRSDEIVKNDKLGRTTELFNEGLRQVFMECRRVLKDDGLLVFTFHHNKVWAWEGIARLLIQAGFYISATPIVRSEGRGEVHSSEGNVRYDCVITCRKRLLLPLDVTDWSSIKQSVLEEAVQWTRRTLESGMQLNDVDVFTILMGKCIERYTRAFTSVNGGGETQRLMQILNETATYVAFVRAKATDELKMSVRA